MKCLIFCYYSPDAEILKNHYIDSRRKNSFFDTVIYGILFKLTDGKSLIRDKVESVLRRGILKGFL